MLGGKQHAQNSRWPYVPDTLAIRGSFASSTARLSRFPATTATACSIPWVTCSGTHKSGCCSSIFEKPHRLRLQGNASIDDNDPLLQEYAEAQLVVRVTVSEIFRNCPRYVHRYKKIQTSEFVPRSTRETPFAPWKRVDIQIALSAKDRARVEREGGLISRVEYEKYINDVKDHESSDLLFGDE
jgi:hypothetical protein